MKRKLCMFFVCFCLFSSMAACANKNSALNNESSSKGEDTQKDTEKETVVDEDIGEASPSNDFIEFDETQGYQVGEKVSIVSETREYELVINTVSYIEASNEYAEKPKHVILIDYTYANYSEEPLLIDEMSFQLTNQEQEVYEPYYFEGKVTANVAESGKSVSAQIAFAQNDDDARLNLVYQDITNSDFEPISIVIEKINDAI